MIPDSLSTKTLIRLFAVICVALFCITFLRAQGNAITLNGTSQYATINTVAGDMASFSTSHTIEFWFKAPSQVDAGQVSLFAVNSSTGGNVVLFLLGNNAIQTGKIYVYDGASATVIDSSNSSYLDDAPHHFAFVRNGATGTFYVDGALQGSGTCTYAFAGTNLWSAGTEYDSGPTATDFFKGSIDDIRVWNAARSIDTIQAHMFSLSATNSNLKGWWKCDEASGTTLNDASGLSNTGTLVGGATFSAAFFPFQELSPGIVKVENSSVAWGDYDSDGDLDVLVTGYSGDYGFFTPVSKIYRNTNGAFAEVYPGSLVPVENSSVAWGDYDNDGDLDILLTGDTQHGSPSATSRIYQNTGSGFTEVFAGSLAGTGSGSAAWGDYDNDGDLDIVLQGSVAKIYQNTGSGFSEVFAGSLWQGLRGSAVWGDYDNDGDLDLLLTGFNGAYFSRIYQNTGNGFVHVYSGSVIGVQYSSAAWGDYDNDGDLDILLTGINGSTRISKIYQNTGSGFSEVFAGSLIGVDKGSAKWGDFDNDGDLDILLTGDIASYNRVSKIYQNIGNGFIEVFSGSLETVDVSSAAWGDYDNDGDLDILLTGNNVNSVTKIYKNTLPVKNTVPTAPTGMTSAVGGNGVLLQWNKSTDTKTPQNGLTYNVRISTTSGGINKKSPMSNTSTGYRRVVQIGNTNHLNSWTISGLSQGTYYWSVQAVDHSFAGSAFAAQGTFTVTPFAEHMGAALTGVLDGSTAWGDFDNDGDLDIVVTGYTISGAISKIYRNTGSTFTEAYSGSLTPVSSGSAEWGDYDRDGDLDILLHGLASGTAVTKVYQNTGSGFTEAAVGALTGVYSGAAIWEDYNGDGRLDILLTGINGITRVAKIYQNSGNWFSELYAGTLTGLANGNIAMGDFDKDGDSDILITGDNGISEYSKIYRNTGIGFTEIYAGTVLGLSYGSAAWGDYDNDGDLDIVVTGMNGGVRHAKVYQNTGSGFTDVYAGSLTGVESGAAAWGDGDGDGDLDILLTGSDGAARVAKLYQNTGSGFTEIHPGSLPPVSYSSVAWGDCDNDGRLDVLLAGSGTSGYISKVYKNIQSSVNTSPATPTGPTATSTTYTAVLHWNKSTDTQTAQNGLTYNLRIGTTPGGSDVLSPMSNTATGYRRIPRAGGTYHANDININWLPHGKYYWSVQAVDHGFAGSSFSTEGSFVISDYTLVSGTGFTGAELGSGTWGDFDNDGDLDLINTGNTGAGGIAKIYRNNGGTFIEVYAGQLPGVFHSTAAWGDYDGDGDLDIVLTGYAAGSTRTSKLYQNTGTGFTEVYPGSLTPVGAGSVEWGDYDRDGDLDILLCGLSASGAVTKIYQNSGSGFTEVLAGSLTGVYSGSASWGDYDNDGDMDIVLTGYTGSARVTKIYENNGTAYTEAYPGSLTGVDYSGAVWGDYDSDGDLDILLHGGTGAATIVKIYQNSGSGFIEVYPGSLTGVHAGDCVWGDYDNDGDLDIVVSGNTGTEQVSKVYRNTGSGFTETNIGALFPGTNSSVSFADYDNDRDLDLLVKGTNGIATYFTRLYKNDTFTINTAPNPPSGLVSTVNGNNVALKWQKASDGQTAQNGLTYNLSIGTTSGGSNTAPPLANFSTGFRHVPKIGNVNQNDSVYMELLPPGTYFWSVQTVDNSFIGSAFSAQGFFNIVTPLPVELVSFTATSKRFMAELNWSTATEINNYGFEIERRAASDRHLDLSAGSLAEGDGHFAWTNAGFVEGNGTTNAPKEYSFADKNLTAGKYYYRLKQIDRDGKFEYSKEVEVTVGSAPLKFELSQNYPNPFNPTTNIEFTVPVSGRAMLKIYNSIGQEVATLFDGIAEAGQYHQTKFDAKDLASGIYIARLVSGERSQVKKLVLMK